MGDSGVVCLHLRSAKLGIAVNVHTLLLENQSWISVPIWNARKLFLDPCFNFSFPRKLQSRVQHTSRLNQSISISVATRLANEVDDCVVRTIRNDKFAGDLTFERGSQ
jgi:hypothetical protein